MNDIKKISDVSFREFVRLCKKPHAPFFTYMYFPLTFPLSYIFFRLHFTANAISILGIVLAVIGGGLIFYGWLLAGLVTILLSYILDFCDGNVARMHYQYLGRSREPQKLGLLLENLYANISYFFFFVPVGYWLYVETGEILFLLLAMGAYSAKLINRYTIMHVDSLNKKEKTWQEKEQPVFSSDAGNKVKYAVVRIIDNARMYFISSILVFLIAPAIFPYFFGAYTIFTLTLNLVKLNLTLVRKLP